MKYFVVCFALAVFATAHSIYTPGRAGVARPREEGANAVIGHEWYTHLFDRASSSGSSSGTKGGSSSSSSGGRGASRGGGSTSTSDANLHVVVSCAGLTVPLVIALTAAL